MPKISKITALSVLLFLTFVPKIASASCVGYTVFDEQCIGNGCNGEYTKTYCSFGCVHGTCESNGGSGLCCGHIYYNAQIQPDGSGGDCGECGNTRYHASALSEREKRHSAELWRAAALGRVDLGGGQSYRMPRLILVPDRCVHRYGLLIQEGSLQPSGGM